MKTINYLALLLLFFGAVACGYEETDPRQMDDSAAAQETADGTDTEQDKDAEPQRTPIAEAGMTQLSGYLIDDLKSGTGTQPIFDRLRNLDPEQLARTLDTDEKRLAFWINVYNGTVQQRLTDDKTLWDDRKKFFSMPIVTVAGKELSLEDIEHGIIRGSETKLGMGYIGKLFPGEYEKMMRVKETDPRIHFALNCGAVDCPPVYSFNAATIDKDLDQLTEAYLRRFSTYVPEKNIVRTTSLMKWFKGDFREFDGVDDTLKKYGIVPEDAKDPDPEYTDYDWTLKLNNFG
ncbi:MAG: DUF547 domain-containing protein [Saprospiraceae bacterium]